MKIRFDTYTKSTEAAGTAFVTLNKHCGELTLSKDGWRDSEVINISGQIDSSVISLLEETLANDFNEDADKL